MVRVCGNRDDAEDVLVEALLSAHRALGQLRDEAGFRAWLIRIGGRVCGKLKRREALALALALMLRAWLDGSHVSGWKKSWLGNIRIHTR